MTNTTHTPALSVNEQNKIAAVVLIEVAFMIHEEENKEYLVSTFLENIKALDMHVLNAVAKRLNEEI